MIQIIQTLAPVVLTIALGTALMHWGFFSESFRVGLERFAFWIGLPSFLVIELSNVHLEAAEGSLKLTGLLIILCVSSMAIAALAAWAMRLKGGAFGTFVQASMRGNLAFVGLPIVLYAAAAHPALDQKIVSGLGVLVLGPIVLLYNVTSVLLLLLPQHDFDRTTLRKIVKPLATNPLIIACVVGLVLAVFKLHLPGVLQRTIESLGKTAPPLSLISLGASLVSLPIRGEVMRATAASAVKVFITPAIAWVGIKLMHLTPEQSLVALIYAACPTAVASYVMATQLKGDAPLAASAVVISTLLSLLALTGVLFLV